MWQIDLCFINSIGIFSDRETLELLTVSLSFEDFLPRLTFTCFCFIFVELFHFYLFVSIVNVIDSLNSIFFLLGECHPLFLFVDCHTCPSIFQYNCPTWFCVTATQCSFINYKPRFSFIHYPYFVWTGTPFFLFSEWNFPLSLIFVWMSHMRISIFFVWISHECPYVSITFKWTLPFVSF